MISYNVKIIKNHNIKAFGFNKFPKQEGEMDGCNKIINCFCDHFNSPVA